MALSRSDFNNGDTLISIRTAINNFENAVVVDVNAKDAQIVALQALVVALTVRVTALETNHP